MREICGTLSDLVVIDSFFKGIGDQARSMYARTYCLITMLRCFSYRLKNVLLSALVAKKDFFVSTAALRVIIFAKHKISPRIKSIGLRYLCPIILLLTNYFIASIFCIFFIRFLYFTLNFLIKFI